MSDFYTLQMEALDGTIIDANLWRGRPILIVNTASHCGFTKQYKALQKIWEEYQDKELIVLGVPSNDFGQQQPEEGEALKTQCEINFGVSFPLLKRSCVKGSNAIPLFKFLAQEGGFLSLPRWNFYKYLINRDGKLSSWHIPLTTPQSIHFKRALKRIIF